MNEILVPTAPGELIDKLTILQLKLEKITDPAKIAHIQREHTALQTVADEALPENDALRALWSQLYEINSDLWAIEDDIRAYERRGDFGAGFVGLARAVYVTNDERARVKKEINVLLGSDLVEEKSYADRGLSS